MSNLGEHRSNHLLYLMVAMYPKEDPAVVVCGWYLPPRSEALFQGREEGTMYHHMEWGGRACSTVTSSGVVIYEVIITKYEFVEVGEVAYLSFRRSGGQ